MPYYMDYPDWFDVEWSKFEKPCPECGGTMQSGPMFDQGCYEGMVYSCDNRKCRSQWVFRMGDHILPYWNSPICPGCESLIADYHNGAAGWRYYCPECTGHFDILPMSEDEEAQP
jgi:hypothetical protein